mgnify:CR=1 FL=1
MATKLIPGIPKTECVWVKHITTNGDIFYTTSKENDRSTYFLYKIVDGKAVKLGKNKSPVALEEKYIK